MEWINEIIIGLIDSYDTNCPYKLCKFLDISLIKVEHDDPILCKNNSAYIRNFLGLERIFIRNDLNEKEESFYIRHELGHAILHPGLKNSYNKHLINKYKLEKEANYFAFKLSDITFDQVELYNMTLEQIASCIGIPHAALEQLATF